MSELLVLLESFYSTFGFTGEEIEDQRGELIAQSHAVELHGRTRGFFFFLGTSTSSSQHFSNSGLSCNQTVVKTPSNPGHI